MEQIAEAIKSNFSTYCETIYCKSSGTLPNIGTDYFLFGNRAEAVAKENNILFSVNWVEGQKTGFFLDQRENRKLLGEFSKGKKVLNTFCYTGGFSIYAMNAGAELVTSVDILLSSDLDSAPLFEHAVKFKVNPITINTAIFFIEFVFCVFIFFSFKGL